MRVRKPPPPLVEEVLVPAPEVPSNPDDKIECIPVDRPDGSLVTVEETVDFSNGRVMMGVSFAIWIVVVLANSYAIVMLGLGKST